MSNVKVSKLSSKFILINQIRVKVNFRSLIATIVNGHVDSSALEPQMYRRIWWFWERGSKGNKRGHLDTGLFSLWLIFVIISLGQVSVM